MQVRLSQLSGSLSVRCPAFCGHVQAFCSPSGRTDSPTPLRCPNTEALLDGAKIGDNLIAQACDTIDSEINPIDDIRASAEYRRHSVHMLTRRLVAQAWASLSGTEQNR